MLSIKKTGGGPNKYKYLNPYEESVARSAGLNASVTGIASAKSFGFQKPTQAVSNNDNKTILSDHSEQNMETGYTEDVVEDFLDFDDIEAENNEEPSREVSEEIKRKTWSKKSTVKRGKLELFERYVQTMEDNNETQKALLRVKEKSLEIKRAVLQIKEENLEIKKAIYDLKSKKDASAFENYITDE